MYAGTSSVSGARLAEAIHAASGTSSPCVAHVRSKGNRTLQNEIAAKLGEMTHMSSRSARQDLMPSFKLLFQRDEEFRIRMTADLEREEEEVGFLLGDKIDSAVVMRVLAEAKKAPAAPAPRKSSESAPAEDRPEPPKPAANQARLFSF